MTPQAERNDGPGFGFLVYWAIGEVLTIALVVAFLVAIGLVIAEVFG